MSIRVVVYIMNYVSLAATHPQVDRSSAEAQPYLIIEKSCRIFFMVELVFNLIIHGLYRDEDSYLRRSWINYMNLALTIIEMILFTSLQDNYFFVRFERVRTFRLLNLI